MFNEASPFLSATDASSTPVIESKKSTSPEGEPEPGALAVTVALKVNVWPKAPSSRSADAVVVASLFTVSLPGTYVIA